MGNPIKSCIIDIETNGLNPDKLWCVVCQDTETKKVSTFLCPSGAMSDKDRQTLQNMLDGYDQIIGHNIIMFDLPVLEKLAGILVPREKVIDTLVLSRLLWVDRPKGHSLEAWGVRLKFPKQDFDEFDSYSDAMVSYCINDVELNLRVYVRLMKKLSDPTWEQSIRTEMFMQHMARDMQDNGFYFDIDAAQKMHEEMLHRSQELKHLMSQEFKPKVVTKGGNGWRIKIPKKQDLMLENGTIRIKNAPKSNADVSVNVTTMPMLKCTELKHAINTVPSKTKIECFDIITELVQKTTTEWFENKGISAEFVERTNHLWSIIVTPTDMFVDCSAAVAMENSDGTSFEQTLSLSTSKRLDIIPFNPGSPKQVIERLWEAGWQPTDKTKGHIDLLRTLQNERRKPTPKEEEKLERFKTYGWKVNEHNLKSLPDLKSLSDIADNGVLNLRECLSLINKKEKNTIEDTISRIRRSLKAEQEKAIIPIDDIINPNNSNAIMELISLSMNKCLNNNLIDVQYVREKKNLLLIIVTPTDMFVDFSAMSVTQDLDGLNFIVEVQKRISQIKACSYLVEWLLVDARRRTLEEWMGAYNPQTGRIHGKFNPLGTRTHRCTHSNPNMGNIPTAKTIKYNNAKLRDLAINLGGRMRSMWQAPKNKWLVGVDMESAHLRIFGHLINDKNFIEALVSGSKEDGTDPHSLNKKALGDVCTDRDRAKTFIFTYLNGGGADKSRDIFACTIHEAREAVAKFVESYKGLTVLKQDVIPADARRGYFEGIDGRLVINDSAHHMMGMYLQNMESVLMKHALKLLWEWMERRPVLMERLKLINWVHDEYVFEFNGRKEDAEYIGKVMSYCIKQAGEDFNLNCPMGGEYKVGKTWLEVH